MSETKRKNKAVNLSSVLTRGLVVWLIIICAESLHGTIRELFLKPLIGDLRARQVGFFTALAIILAITFIFIRWVQASNNKQLLAVGITWAALTFVFEALIVRPALDVSWERFLADYNIVEGGVMAIGLIILALAPFIAAYTRGRSVESVNLAQ